MADATGGGSTYHYQATGGPAAVVTYATFRKLLALEGDDVDQALQDLVIDKGAIYGAFGRLWVTGVVPTFVPPAPAAGAPTVAGVPIPAIVTRGTVPPAVTSIMVSGQGKQTAGKTKNGK